MLNAYQMGRLTVQPARFAKIAQQVNLQNALCEQFIKAARIPELENPNAIYAPGVEKGPMSLEGVATKQLPGQVSEQTIKMMENMPEEVVEALRGHHSQMAGGPVTRAARAGEEAASGAYGYLKDKAKSLGGSISGLSEDVGTALGGVKGSPEFLKNPHTRAIGLLLALLAAGGGAYALGRGGSDKDR